MKDRFENYDKLALVEESYERAIKLLQRHDHRILRVDGTGTEDEVAERIHGLVSRDLWERVTWR